jgi:hypothetical protein
MNLLHFFVLDCGYFFNEMASETIGAAQGNFTYPPMETPSGHFETSKN